VGSSNTVSCVDLWVFLGAIKLLRSGIEFNQSSDTKWCVPKLLVRLKMSLNWLNSGIVRSSGHTPNSQH
jgi:hypothetical protein